MEKLDGNVGDTINLKEILICGEGDSIKIGTPFVEGCSVACEVTEQLRGKKIIVFKKTSEKKIPAQEWPSPIFDTLKNYRNYGSIIRGNHGT